LAKQINGISAKLSQERKFEQSLPVSTVNVNQFKQNLLLWPDNGNCPMVMCLDVLNQCQSRFAQHAVVYAYPQTGDYTHVFFPKNTTTSRISFEHPQAMSNHSFPHFGAREKIDILN